MLIDGAGGFDGGVETVVGAKQRKSGRGGEKLGVGGRGEKLVGVVRIESLAGVERNHFDAPETAGDIRLGQNAVYAGRERTLVGRRGVDRQQNGKHSDERGTTAKHASTWDFTPQIGHLELLSIQSGPHETSV